MESAEVFGNIYKNGVWGDGSRESPRSGSGSNPKNAKTYVDIVRNFVLENQITSVVDFGHGDWEMWENYNFENINYLGVDVADGLSNQIEKKFGGNNRRFKQLDISKEELQPAQLLLSKDVLQHLPTEGILTFLEQLNKFQYSVICNDIYIKGSILFEIREFLQIRKRLNLVTKFEFPLRLNRRENNTEIFAGEFRGINLEKNPFRYLLSDFKIEIITDYDGPFRPGIKKRIYLISNLKVNLN